MRATLDAPGGDPLDYRCDTLILGIGNLLWADEGFGVRALERLHADWCFGPGVRLLDGGTQGLYLLPYVEGCRRLLILDAVDYGLAPGTLKLVRDQAVPAFMGVRKMSLHQTGFQEVLSVARLRGWDPEGLALVGVSAGGAGGLWRQPLGDGQGAPAPGPGAGPGDPGGLAGLAAAAPGPARTRGGHHPGQPGAGPLRG